MEETLILTTHRGLGGVNWTNDDVRAMFVNGEHFLAFSDLTTAGS